MQKLEKWNTLDNEGKKKRVMVIVIIVALLLFSPIWHFFEGKIREQQLSNYNGNTSVVDEVKDMLNEGKTTYDSVKDVQSKLDELEKQYNNVEGLPDTTVDRKGDSINTIVEVKPTQAVTEAPTQGASENSTSETGK